MNRWICPWNRGCPAIVGNVMVYRQQSHMTRTYVTTLDPYVGNVMLDVTDGLFGAVNGG